KRNAAFCFIAARQITHVRNIGENLLAAVFECKTGVRARGLEQSGNRRRHRHAISRAMESLQQSQSIDNRGQFPRQFAGDSKRMKTPSDLPILQQLLVADREQRTTQGRKYRQLVFGPLNGGQRGTQGLDLCAIVKRAAADQEMGNAASFEGSDVGSLHVLLKTDEAAEQKADM